jgi:ABC-type phosphate transport system substrate-binding protein
MLQIQLTMKTTSVGICLACAALLAGALRAAPIQGSVLIANKGVPVDSLSAAALKDIYTGKTAYWQGGQSVVIAVLAGKTDAALEEVSGMDASQFKTFWQRLVFSGRGQLPKKADDADSLVALVASTQGAIALVPADAGLNGVKILDVK